MKRSTLANIAMPLAFVGGITALDIWVQFAVDELAIIVSTAMLCAWLIGISQAGD